MSSPGLIVEQDSLIPFPIERILDNSVTDFDLFLKVSDHFILYGASGYHWFRRELSDLLKNGVAEFLIRSQDNQLARMYEKVSRIPTIEKNQKPKERIVSIEQIGTEFTKCLYEGELTPSALNKARQLSDALLACIAEDRSSIQALSGLGDHDYYTYVHSLRVAAYAVAVAMEMGLSDVEKLRELCLGAMLHDVGKKQIPLSLINKAGALNEDEWLQLKQHPELGDVVVKETTLASVPREIILHHHEKNDGSGYPHGLNATSLLPEVQIVTLADVFDALTSSRSYQNKRSRYEALDFIRHKMIPEKLSRDAYQALISCLVAE